MKIRNRQALFLAAAFVVGIIFFRIAYKALTIPMVGFLKLEHPSKSAYMERYNGKNKIEHKWVPIGKISENLQRAVLIAEDSKFYSHGGIDWEALKEAFKRNFEKGELAVGGSTITMQLARNLYLDPDKSIFRKLKEMRIALAMEQFLSKKRILELYLNFAEWGDGIYGAEAAAQHYFGKSCEVLDEEEAAFLAAMLPNPRRYEKKQTPFMLNRMGRIEELLNK